MTSEMMLRVLFSLIVAGVFAWRIYARANGEKTPDEDRPRYAPYIPATVLPVFLAALTVFGLVVYGPEQTAKTMLSLCFGIFLHISVYYVILLLLLPLLRRFISARACAALWLVPNYLYITQQSFMTLTEPKLVLYAPERVVWTLFGIWLLGFFAVMVWKITSHLIFRRQVLKPARDAMGQEQLLIWEEELERAQIRHKLHRPVVSPSVHTPLSVGMFRRTIRVVLPERAYRPEELRLIFRHELIHIGREDSSTKFFLVFCTASCWFNPLMWRAMGRSAEDLELSCDETVLLEAEPETRKEYARLILGTAGDSRGFTTCLSASAQALRYRLKSITGPRKRLTGGIIVGLAFFLLCVSHGYVALAYDEAPGKELIFSGQDVSQYEIESINYRGEGDQEYAQCTDPEALGNYLAELTFQSVTGNYSFPVYGEENHSLFVLYQGPQGVLGITLENRSLAVSRLYEERSGRQTYYFGGNVDWDYVESLLTFPEMTEEYLPYPPEMTVEPTNQDRGPILASALLAELDDEPVDHWNYKDDGISVHGVVELEGWIGETVVLLFSESPDTAYTVEIVGMEGNTITRLENAVVGDPLVLQEAHYTVYATFLLEGRYYTMEYKFDVVS